MCHRRRRGAVAAKPHTLRRAGARLGGGGGFRSRDHAHDHLLRPRPCTHFVLVVVQAMAIAAVHDTVQATTLALAHTLALAWTLGPALVTHRAAVVVAVVKEADIDHRRQALPPLYVNHMAWRHPLAIAGALTVVVVAGVATVAPGQPGRAASLVTRRAGGAHDQQATPPAPAAALPALQQRLVLRHGRQRARPAARPAGAPRAATAAATVHGDAVGERRQAANGAGGAQAAPPATACGGGGRRRAVRGCRGRERDARRRPLA